MCTGPRIYLTGAACAGVTTLGQALAASWGLRHLDVDDYFWLPTDPPYTCHRPVADRLRLLSGALGQGGWVLSGSFDDWGDPLVEDADLIVFLLTETPLRMTRLERRESHRFGARIDAGGDMHDIHRGFRDWAAQYDVPGFHGRSRDRHERWLLTQPAPVLRLDGARPVDQLVEAVGAALGRLSSASAQMPLFKSVPEG